MTDLGILNWLGEANYITMQWVNVWWWQCWVWIFFSGTLISMSPLIIDKDHSFLHILGVWARKIILLLSLLLLCIPIVQLYLYDSTGQDQTASNSEQYLSWFASLAATNWYKLIPAMLAGWTIRFCFNRYVLTLFSAVARLFRRKAVRDKASDIEQEATKFKKRVFNPSEHYCADKGLVVGLDVNGAAVYITWQTWRENMMQIIGPTGYGKGVILGCLMDQAIRKGHTLFYIDPKDDEFAPHIMFAACKAAGRKFYYVSMDDAEMGRWGPFMGGTLKDGFTRLEIALGLELTGDPGTDYFKTQEIPEVREAFKRTRRVDSLYNEISGSDANKSEAELSAWMEYDSLTPKANKGFSIEKAIKENAVVYFKGSLDDRIIKTATKIFIVELVQECRRLYKSQEKTHHLTAVVDELSFLVSKQLKEALATIRGFGVNFVNAYQSPEDLINTDDINLNGKALKHSIDVNSQIKAVYGGADFETAEWAANLSGTIIKEVTRSETVDVKPGGGEIWEANRSISTLEENLVHTNVVLTLPPGVCVFIQPGELLRPIYTSFVPIQDKQLLADYISHKSVHSDARTENQNDVEDSTATEHKDYEDLERFQAIAEKDATKKLDDLPTELRSKTEKNKARKAKQRDKKQLVQPEDLLAAVDPTVAINPEFADIMAPKQSDDG